MVDLTTFFEEFDVESLRARVLEQDGIDIQGVYCLATGRLMGTFDEDVIRDAIDQIEYDDEDELVDDLIVRVVASMRPSPAMNRPDRFLIREMMSRRPVDALAYLVNRLNGTRWLLTERDGAASFQPLYNRIATHRHWTALAAEGLDLTPWIHYLVEIDAKMNLHDVKSPCVDVDRKNQMIVTNVGTPLFSMVTLDNHEELFKLFESWAFEKLNEYDERDKRMTAEANWIRGNTHSKAAFTRSYLENPEIANRRAAENHAKKTKKAGRPAVSPKTRKLNEETNQFLHLLEGILDGTIETAATKPAPKPRVMTGGMLKLNLAKRKEA